MNPIFNIEVNSPTYPEAVFHEEVLLWFLLVC